MKFLRGHVRSSNYYDNKKEFAMISINELVKSAPRDHLDPQGQAIWHVGANEKTLAMDWILDNRTITTTTVHHGKVPALVVWPLSADNDMSDEEIRDGLYHIAYRLKVPRSNLAPIGWEFPKTMNYYKKMRDKLAETRPNCLNSEQLAEVVDATRATGPEQSQES